MASGWASVRRYFATNAVAHVATILPDGSPHSVPVWVGVEGEQLAIFMIAGSRKDKNLQGDPRLALSVTSPDDPLDMATVRGRAVRRIEGEDALPIVDRIAHGYTGEPYELRSGLVAFLIEPQVCWARDYSD
ncbi:TIGR03618 family F420-dependent PPOX class oxidoreductase [Microbacterium marinilacus]|uniref:PPOX class F420-dependent oxidoreductase n=1 Tax=Microbacterium marinilacus TaxID=415209 RepID=A0ABP7BGL8_9MICO|nr:TIGR03618 family F420-dependent PPOX class oxidoreductase [Microbacterium marinilacus]MBY0689618.1 TIGR03618 family F420-dependent PPOX class oxidoreductase [Microbacterium marinilacus]